MSRAWLPRRIRETVPAGIFALAALSAANAFAQSATGDARAITVLGGDRHAEACVAGVIAGQSDERLLDECTRALRYPHLTRRGEEQVLINRGVVHMRRHESQLALDDFNAVIARAPDSPEAHLNRGATLVQLQQYGPAIISLTRAMQLNVSEPYKAYYNRGVAREALGNLQGAYEDYQAALQMEPEWGPANAEIARFVHARRDRLATMDRSPTP